MNDLLDSAVAAHGGLDRWNQVRSITVDASWPGFVTEEITPIEADGETWRRLKVTFPDHIKSHTRQQISCFGPDGLLRRHDFTIDILGGATGMLYATDYRDVDGIIIPATRRDYAWQGDYQLIPEPLLVAIDMGEITIR
jgi:hypothetical protein